MLEKNGFTVERGVAGIPTAWVATWGSGKPVIALGSDIDGIPQASQKPGVAYHDPIIEGAPGHGEGHNSGMPLNIIAAIAVKQIMEREKLPGTLMLWPGVAEELRRHQGVVRARRHVQGRRRRAVHARRQQPRRRRGASGGGNGLVSVEYTFEGETAHSAGAPWRGRSRARRGRADERRLELPPRAPAPVAALALRDHQRRRPAERRAAQRQRLVSTSARSTQPHIKELWDIGDKMAEGAALMTNTKWTSRILGTAYPQHMNKADRRDDVREHPDGRACRRGARPIRRWPRRCRRSSATPTQDGLGDEARRAGRAGRRSKTTRGGGSDDIGDISWNVPTVTLRYPGEHPRPARPQLVERASPCATPIAHKGVVAGAKVQAMTVLDLLTKPELVKAAWDYFNNVQTKDVKYIPFITRDTPPPTHLNKAILEKYREQMRKYYYDPTKYPTYLDQLGHQVPDGADDAVDKQQDKQEQHEDEVATFAVRRTLRAAEAVVRWPSVRRVA